MLPNDVQACTALSHFDEDVGLKSCLDLMETSMMLNSVPRVQSRKYQCQAGSCLLQGFREPCSWHNSFQSSLNYINISMETDLGGASALQDT